MTHPLLILVTLASWAHPMTLTELSNPSNSGQTLRLCTAVGDPVTVLTDARPPDDIAAAGCTIELRSVTLRDGLPDALPAPTADGKGPWAVQITPQAPGACVVSLGSGLTVELTVYPVTTRADIGLGLYTDYATYGANAERAVLDLLRQYGCNTLTVYGHNGTDGTDIARQIDAAIDTGLLDTRFPVLFVPDVATAEDMLALSLDMRSKADKGHGSHRLASMLGSTPPKHCWPELVGCNLDHPTVAQRQQVLAITDMYRVGGAMTSAAHISPAQVDKLSDALSVCIVDAAELTAPGKRQRVWSYTTRLKPSDADLARYYAGAWSYSVRPQVALAWSAAELVAIGPNGPMPTAALVGLRDGAADYKALRDLQRLCRQSKSPEATEAAAWLAGLPSGPFDVGADPPDCGALREQALQYITTLRTQ